jgi:hypothetical protein
MAVEIPLGSRKYPGLITAVKAYNDAALRVFGEFAFLNTIPGQ